MQVIVFEFFYRDSVMGLFYPVGIEKHSFVDQEGSVGLKMLQ